MTLNLILWIGGAILIVLGFLRIQQPLSRVNELRRLDENAQRYDAWRGGSRATAARPPNGRTGADEMRELMRNRARLWAVVIGIGVVAVVAGFVIR